MDGVSCEYKWLQENIHKFLCVQCEHVGITDTNHNVKNNWYHNLLGTCAAVIGGYFFDPGLLHLTGVPNNMWQPENFASDLLVLNIASHGTIKTLLQMDIIVGGDIAVVYFTL